MKAVQEIEDQGNRDRDNEQQHIWVHWFEHLVWNVSISKTGIGLVLFLTTLNIAQLFLAHTPNR